MKILIITVSAVLAAAVIFIIFLRASTSPLTQEEAVNRIQELVDSAVKSPKSSAGGIVYIKSEKAGIEKTFISGTVDGKLIKPDQPFHTASIGKAFTATLTGILAERGLLSLDDPLNRHLEPGLLDGLFVIDGKDHSSEVTISMLLSHTSGAADYFEDPASGSEPARELVLKDPERFWSPEDLIAFSKDFQHAVGKPGEKYHYSDTGYILLGLVIEKVSGMKFHEFMHEAIFRPLGMNDSYVCFYSEPGNPRRKTADIFLNGVMVNDYRSLSIDWSGGGIISTVSDLALFLDAINTGSLLSRPISEQMLEFDNRFMRGIRYGMGFMEYHFDEFSPGLGGLPEMRGHMGILGTQMFTSDPPGTTYVSSFGSDSFAGSSVRLMIKILSVISRVETTS